MYKIPKLNELIHRELAELILREMELDGAMVTIVGVSTAKDWSRCEVTISIFPTAMTDDVLKVLRKSKGFLKRRLNDKLDFRVVPDLVFRIDKGALNLDKVEEILHKDIE